MAWVLPLLWLLAGVLQAQYDYVTEHGNVRITKSSCADAAIIIPDTIDGLPVTSIGDQAFLNCSQLTAVTIPNSVTNLGVQVFYGCARLNHVTLPDQLINLGNGAFFECTGLTNVHLPTRLTLIGDSAFYNCTNLTNVIIPDSVTHLGDAAFSGCSRLAGVVLGKNLTSIRLQTFLNCTSLTSAVIPENTASIGSFAFFGCISLTNVSLPVSLISIGGGAFFGCTGLTGITIPSGVTEIGESAFFRNTSLQAITVEPLNSFYSSVDGVLFNRGQTALINYPPGRSGSYAIPLSVALVGSAAFADCPYLVEVTIPASVTYLAENAFARCPMLKAITVAPLNPTYGSIDGVLFNRSQTTLLQYPGGKAGSYTIPSQVTVVEKTAFEGSTQLTSISISTSVTRIGFWAFLGCVNLTGVYFRGNPPANLGLSIFEGSNQVKVYYLPGSSGWGPTLAGRPALLWDPRISIGDGNLAGRENPFGFTINGTSGMVVVVEGATDLANLFWKPVGTNILADGSSYFKELEWAEHPNRFYRLRFP